MTVQTTPKLFSEAQWARITALVAELDAPQKWWLSGYLAAGDVGQLAVAPAPAAPSRVLIAYGTETGNCKQLAEQLAADCQQRGIGVEVADFAAIKPRRLTKVSFLVVIVATHGDGDPPETVTAFHESLMGDAAPTLPELQFAVLALGDSTYDNYCVTGRQWDERLASLGAQRLLPRVECDVDFEKPAREWMDQLLPLLPQAETATPATSLSGASAGGAAAAEVHDKNNPLLAELMSNVCLSEPGRAQPIYHLELAVDAAALGLQPGDAVGVFSDNPPALVKAVLDACDLSGESPVTVAGEAMSLVQALREQLDITIPGTGFLELWADLTGHDVLTTIRDSDTKVRRTFLRGHQILALLQRFPATPDPQQFVEALRPLQPRLYDAANLLNEDDDELHLTVQAYSYPFGSRMVDGIASHYLAALEPGEEIRIYPHRNRRFQLPEDPETPVILVAEGTGLAPYRAFWQAIDSGAHKAPGWLVFAEHSFEEDFLYQVDVLQMKEKAVLERVDTVFRQDQPGRTLADPLLDRFEELQEWLERGAHLYLCGNKSRLDECEEALSRHANAVSGEALWKNLAKEKRIHRNVY